MSEKTKKILLVLIALAIGVAAGAAGYKNTNHWLRKQQSNAAAQPGPYDRQTEMLRDAFVDPLIAGENLVNPLCKSADNMARQIEDSCAMPADKFIDAYKKLTIKSVEKVNFARLKVSYDLQQPYEAWAYHKPFSKVMAESIDEPAQKAFLIIPGSGINESSKIFNGDPGDYHGDIAAQAAKFGDVFVLVKPNEDFLAINDGKKKLSYNYITYHLLNREQSYSARYIVDSVAIVRALKQQYKQVYVVGLSQGGTAALYNALLSHPSGAMIASGYSVLMEQADCMSFNQIALPGLASHYNSDRIRSDIAASPTKFVFSYGTGELGLYRIEANESDTAKYFGNLANVKFLTHDGGHAFAPNGLEELLK